MNSEVWKDIVNYEGLYQVSNLGRVRRLKFYLNSFNPKGLPCIKAYRERVLKPWKLGEYLAVNLSKENNVSAGLTVHTLVAEHFISKPQGVENLVVNHLDCDKWNNKSDNLEWTHQSGNIKHAWQNNRCAIRSGESNKMSKLKESDIFKIREFHSKGKSLKVLSDQFSISTGHISAIVNRRRWTHI